MAGGEVGRDRLDPGHPAILQDAARRRMVFALRQERDAALDDGALHDRLDLLGGAPELLVGEDRRAFEGELARDLDPRPRAVEVVADLDGDGARDAIRAKQQHVQRMAAPPGEALLRVVGGPDVVRGERVDDPRIGDRPVMGDLGPRADAYAVRLRDAAVARQRVGGRLGVGPYALFEGAPELRLVRRADDVVALMFERWEEEEPLVL